ncbi:MAG: ABC transporter permease, partial [Alphaproteobacteria bacterium]|nr:ABC transporter permease [Alphaproteobacteria bacterium]
MTRPASTGTLRRLWDSDIAWSFRRSPLAIGAGIVTGFMLLLAGLAPWIAPHNPLNPASIDLLNSLTPPIW